MTVGQRLRRLRRDITQKTVADACRITTSAYANYEQDRRIPRVEVLRRLAKFYNTTIDEILGTEN